MVSEQLHKTKIAGSAIDELKRSKNMKREGTVTGRSVSLFEVISLILGVEQVHTNQEFVHVPTVPLEEQPAMYNPRII